METIDKEGLRDRLQERAMDQASSAWYTYNQHYKAANFYKFLNYGLSSIIAILGGVLSYGLIWDKLPAWFMISLAVTISVISGIQLVVRPGEKRDQLEQSAQNYHSLFDDLVDYITLDLPSDDQEMATLRERYRGLRERRTELNEEMPDVSSLWYHYIKRTKGSDGMQEAFAGDGEKSVFEAD